jgi:hypothetical protein
MNGDLGGPITALQYIWIFISHGGWVIFVLLAIYILYLLYMNEIQTQYIESIEWVFLEVKPPKANTSTFYNAEQIFIQLHQLFDNFTFQEKYIEGKVIFWISLEIISLGGTISYILKVPKKQVDLIESAFYANFPALEITEVQDYLSKFEYNPDNDKYDLFGAEFGLLQPQSIPIRTYKEFEEHAGLEGKTIIDPLSPLFEVYNHARPGEFFGIQFLIRPVPDGSWKDEAEALVKKLAGEEVNPETGKKSPAEFFKLDDVTKQRIISIKAKLGKPGFQTKIRLLHIGTKEDFNKNAKKMVLSPFKIFSSANFNGFKPGFAPKLDYRISPTLEAPYINYYVRQRKIDLFTGYKARSHWIGTPMYVLNTEELATLFHFPITTATTTVAGVETTDMKKAQPPANLPI